NPARERNAALRLADEEGAPKLVVLTLRGTIAEPASGSTLLVVVDRFPPHAGAFPSRDADGQIAPDSFFPEGNVDRQIVMAKQFAKRPHGSPGILARDQVQRPLAGRFVSKRQPSRRAGAASVLARVRVDADVADIFASGAKAPF